MKGCPCGNLFFVFFRFLLLQLFSKKGINYFAVHSAIIGLHKGSLRVRRTLKVRYNRKVNRKVFRCVRPIMLVIFAVGKSNIFGLTLWVFDEFMLMNLRLMDARPVVRQLLFDGDRWFRPSIPKLWNIL